MQKRDNFGDDSVRIIDCAIVYEDEKFSIKQYISGAYAPGGAPERVDVGTFAAFDERMARMILPKTVVEEVKTNGYGEFMLSISEL